MLTIFQYIKNILQQINFIYDPKSTKILLVQSNGNMWGIPKGTIKDNETSICCALREVHEETGLVLDIKDISNSTILYNNCKYFYTAL